MESKKIRSFEDLECWKACREIRNRFSLLIKKLPYQERNALADGIRRASRSITENIAEGYGRSIIRKTFSSVDIQEVHYTNSWINS